VGRRSDHSSSSPTGDGVERTHRNVLRDAAAAKTNVVPAMHGDLVAMVRYHPPGTSCPPSRLGRDGFSPQCLINLVEGGVAVGVTIEEVGLSAGREGGEDGRFGMGDFPIDPRGSVEGEGGRSRDR
jgi:hypothetical protein